MPIHNIALILDHQLPFDMAHKSCADAQLAMRILVKAGAEVVGPTPDDS